MSVIMCPEGSQSQVPHILMMQLSVSQCVCDVVVVLQCCPPVAAHTSSSPHLSATLQYICEALMQREPRREIVDDMAGATKKLLVQYHRLNAQQYPEVGQ